MKHTRVLLLIAALGLAALSSSQDDIDRRRRSVVIQAGGSFEFVTDASSHPPPSSGDYEYDAWGPAGGGSPTFPGVGSTYVDPVFGLTVTVLTQNHPSAWFPENYSRNGFWNADETAFLVDDGAGSRVVNVSTGSNICTGVPDVGDEASFAPDDPDLIYYFSGSQLRSYDISVCGSDSLVKDFGSTLGALGGSTDYISADGNIFVLLIGANSRVWRKSDDTLYTGNLPGSAGGGWIGILPTGSYVIRAASDEFTSYAINHGADSVSTSGTMFWNLCGDHGDPAYSTEGDYVAVEECFGDAGVYLADVTIDASALSDTALRAANVAMVDYTFSDAPHVSCSATTPWCITSVESTDDLYDNRGTWRAFKSELVAVRTESPYDRRRLVHHRSRDIGGGDGNAYYYQPRPSCSWLGNKCVWSSNFNEAPADGYDDLYIVTIPQ